MKLNGWTIGSAVVGIGSAIFGIAKGIADSKEADKRETEKINRAVEDYMANMRLDSRSEQ